MLSSAGIPGLHLMRVSHTSYMDTLTGDKLKNNAAMAALDTRKKSCNLFTISKPHDMLLIEHKPFIIGYITR